VQQVARYDSKKSGETLPCFFLNRLRMRLLHIGENPKTN